MCGIMAYVGKKEAFSIIIEGLKKLEYRGYDSSGIATVNGSVHLLKKEGKVKELSNYSVDKNTSGNIGLGHTRWATHGAASDLNAHPHQSQSKRLTLVHNGIIENYEPLKKMLIEHGFKFISDTDSEVLVQLIEWYQIRYQLDSKVALGRALQVVQGSFAIVLHDDSQPNELLIARRQSPLVIGFSDTDHYISSDSMTFSDSIQRIAYLKEDVIAQLSQNKKATFFSLDDNVVDQEIKDFDYRKYAVSKGEFESFTLKEIFEQNLSISRTLETHIDFDSLTTKLETVTPLFDSIERIIITACGTSWHSALIAEYLIEKYAGLNVEVEYASEFEYKSCNLSKKDVVIGISQSGETADTISALKIAKSKGLRTIALVNGVNSTIARMVDKVLYLDAGMEIGVASTKAFTSQLSAIMVLTIAIAQKRNSIVASEISNMISDLIKLPGYVSEVLATTELGVKRISREIAKSKSALFLGRGITFPIALEGALKLKEMSYIHAEGYPSGEMKHGPIALIEQDLPVIAIINDDISADKIISNIQEVKARKASVIIIKNKSIQIPDNLADHVISIPDAPTFLNPIIQTIPLQFLAYYVARIKDCNIDQPRNLAKSVTVE